MLVFHLDELITCHADATGTYKHVPLYEIYVCANTLYKYVMNTHTRQQIKQFKSQSKLNLASFFLISG